VSDWGYSLNPTCLLQSVLNPTCLLQVNDFSTHLYLDSGPLYLEKLARRLLLMVYLYQTLDLRETLFNQSIICRKVLFSMYYVIFRTSQ
jgi:hypothetical protein